MSLSTPKRFGRSTTRLELRPLEDRWTPALLSGTSIVVAADAGGPPEVRVFDGYTQQVTTQFLAFDAGFLGGVRVAVGDVTGDGTLDLIAGAGPSGGPNVRVYDGRTGEMVSNFFAFGTNFTGGVFVAAADLDKDGTDEILVGAGAGGGPQVSVFDARGRQKQSFFAYTPDFLGGVRVAATDVNDDGFADVITAPGFGGGSQINIYDGADGLRLLRSFFAFDPSFMGGVNLTAGDLNGDRIGEIIVGAGVTGGPQVNVFQPTGRSIGAFFAYESTFQGGARVAVADLNGDGRDEILTIAGPSGSALVNVYHGDRLGTPITSFFGFPTGQSTGFYVAGSPTSLNIPATPTTTLSSAYRNVRQIVINNTTILPIPVGLNSGFWNGPLGWNNWGWFAGLGYGWGLWNLYDGFGLFGPSNFFSTSFFQPTFYGEPTFLPTFETFYDPIFEDGFGFFDDGGVGDFWGGDWDWWDGDWGGDWWDDGWDSDWGGDWWDGGWDGDWGGGWWDDGWDFDWGGDWWGGWW